jgi:hypothetical protein
VKARVVVLAVIAAALVALPGSALGKGAHSASNSQNFPDSTGEDANAPDITSVAVSNDDSGHMVFKVNISNRPALTADMFVLLFLDADANPATGDTQSLGADYVIELDPGAVGLFKWDGTNFSAAPSQTSLTYSYDATGATINVAATDLGGTKKLNFAAVAASGFAVDASGNPDITNLHQDNAPDLGHGFYAYQVIEKITLSPIAFTTSPKPAKAGKAFSVSLAANESDTGEGVKAATVTCTATIAGRHVTTASHSLTNGIATCVWRLPKTSKTKTIRGTITITAQGATLKKSFSAKIS